MGQTDSQFKAFIRFILDDIKELQSEPDDAKRSAKIDKIIDNLQKTLDLLDEDDDVQAVYHNWDE